MSFWWWLLLPCGGVLAIVLLRPYYLFRGLNDEERATVWPGDNEVAGAKPSGSRGIDIAAPASSVWPWITQIGQDRAGFYSYTWLENLFGAKMPEYCCRVQKWSTREPGQKLRMASVERFGPIAEMDITSVTEKQSIVAVNREGTWAFILVPTGPDSCRMIARGTWVPSPNLILRLMRAILFDPIHYTMEWKMLRRIKELVEQERKADASLVKK